MKIEGITVDDEQIDRELSRLMEQQADRPEAMKAREDEVRRLAEQNVLARTLLRKEAGKRFPKVAERDYRKRAEELRSRFGAAAELDQFRVLIEDDIRVEYLLREVRKGVPGITEAEAHAEYERDPASWAEPEQIHCSHIVRHTFGGQNPNTALHQIMAAQAELKRGRPFAEVARRYSDQYGQAGDLGTFPRGHMVEKFENVVFRMPPGEPSEVFETEFGYHIALVHERHPARHRSFEEAKKDIIRTLKQRRNDDAVEAFVEELKRRYREDGE